MWVGIDNQKDVMHCPTCNITCVCYVNIYFIMLLILKRRRTILKQDIKVLKSRKSPIFLLLCGIKSYVILTQPFWSLRGVYSNRIFLDLSIIIKFAANKHLIYIQYNINMEKYIYQENVWQFILVFKMVILGRIIPLNITPINCKMITRQ